VRRHGDRRQPVARGNLAHHAAQPGEIAPRLLHRAAHTRSDLDLRTQELGAHLAFDQGRTFRHHLGGRVDDDIARIAVDQQVFLLDADGEVRFRVDHS